MVNKNELSEAEWQIIRVIWEKEPCAAPTVVEELKHTKDWTYSTVKTMMDRMVKKRFLSTEKVRNLILYKSEISPQQAKSKEIGKVVNRAFDGALTPMMQFLIDNEKLDKKDLDELEKLIKEKKSSKNTER